MLSSLLSLFILLSPTPGDRDGDALPDLLEDLDGDGTLDWFETDPDNPDTDGDGLEDGVEDLNLNGRRDPGESDPRRADTDGGGTDDGRELEDGSNPLEPFDDLDADIDEDGLSGRLELEWGLNPRDQDSDGDGLMDGLELEGLTDPLNPDSDGDGLRDGEEDLNLDGARTPGETDPMMFDTDGGGTDDGQELRDGSDPLWPEDDWEQDPDGDGLSSRQEREHALDPFDGDSDDDGLLDGEEPGWAEDRDDDGLISALDPDSDNDGLFDGLESGLVEPPTETDWRRGRFRPDLDPETQTDPQRTDTDGGGLSDGAEDLNGDGALSFGESDPLDPLDDAAGELDSDGDGLPDLVEQRLGCDPFDADSDDDGLADGAEPNFGVDHDLDGLINALDPDSDGDGLPDGLELGVSFRLPDTEGGIFRADQDPETVTSPLLADSDAGGVIDGLEDRDGDGQIGPGESDPNDPSDDIAPDSDNDGMPDAVEHWAGLDPEDADSDDDGVPDGQEGLQDSEGDGLPNALDPDSDNDGLPDGLEMGLEEPHEDSSPGGPFRSDLDPESRTDPHRRDSDGDGRSDGEEDLNRNGRVDPGESDPLKFDEENGAELDSDGDGLSDEYEQARGLYPEDSDSDDDGVPDGEEGAEDSDGDGLIDALDPDSDNDGLFDGTEMGRRIPSPGTDLQQGFFIPDADPESSTDPRNPDTDGGGRSDGAEDSNGNGALDEGESDPRNPEDDYQEETEPKPELHIRGGCSLGLGLGRRGVWPLLLLLISLLLPCSSRAFRADGFRPRLGEHGGFEVEGAAIPAPGALRLGLSLHHSRGILLAERENAGDLELLRHSSQLQLLLAWVPLPALRLGLDWPLAWNQGKDPEGQAFSELDSGDPRLLLQSQILKRDSWALSLALPLSLPLGETERWQGEESLSLGGALLGELQLEALQFYAQLGGRYRPHERFYDLEISSELTAALALGYSLGDSLPLLLGELSGAWPGVAPKRLSLRLGGEWLLGEFSFSGALERGLSEGAGEPAWRVLLGGSWEKR